MIVLNSNELSVDLLDPVADRERFGTRYCTGGYIFQVNDAAQGPLLSGPTYPDDFDWFNGQGAPDTFHNRPLLDPDGEAGEGLVLGIGICDLKAKQVRQFCEWEVEASTESAVFTTRHEYGPYSLRLIRTVSLHRRTLRSETRVRNEGEARVSVQWFPHPFFPQPDGDELCKIIADIGIPENNGYELDSSGFIKRKSWPWTDGYFQALDHRASDPLVILQKHPLVGLVAVTFYYQPGFFPIWGNRATFSFEPYLEHTVGSGSNLDWTVEYEF